MKITILCVGKLKEKYLVDACAEYIKRLGKYAKIEVVELSETPPRDLSEFEINREKEKETENIIKRLNARDYKILTSLKGETLDSVRFASFFRDKQNEGKSSFVFIIGGSYGTTAELDKVVDFSWKLSDLTFPHQLTRLILLEQIYRACKINNRETYHK